MMKQIHKLGWTAVVAVLIVACQKDPYDGKQVEITGALPPHERKIDEVVNERDLKIVASAERLEFVEGVEGKVSFTGLILIPGLKGSIIIENINEFPGAVFDEVSGTFAWQPDKNFNGGELEVKRILRVALLTKKTDQHSPYVRHYTYDVTVTKVLTAPEIITDFSDMAHKTIHEDGSLTMKVVVKDSTASIANKKLPYLEAFQTSTNPYKVPLMFVKKGEAEQDQKDPSLWILTYDLILQNVFLTDSFAFTFDVQAVSGYNLRSPIKKVTTTAVMKLLKPETSLPNDFIPVKAGQDFAYTFSVYIPMNKGRLVIASTDLTQFAGHGAATLSCEAGASVSITQCTFMWSPPTTVDEPKDFEGSIVAKSVAFGSIKYPDQQEQTQTIPLKFRLTSGVNQ